MKAYEPIYITARPHGTLSTWPKEYSVPRNDLSWGTMYVHTSVPNHYKISVSWG